MLCYQKEFVSQEPHHRTSPEGATGVGLSRRVPFSLPTGKRRRAWQREKKGKGDAMATDGQWSARKPLRKQSSQGGASVTSAARLSTWKCLLDNESGEPMS